MRHVTRHGVLHTIRVSFNHFDNYDAATLKVQQQFGGSFKIRASLQGDVKGKPAPCEHVVARMEQIIARTGSLAVLPDADTLDISMVSESSMTSTSGDDVLVQGLVSDMKELLSHLQTNVEQRGIT